MTSLLFLVIIPSAIGIYYLIKPPAEKESEAGLSTAPQVAQIKASQETPALSRSSSSILRKHTVNE